MTDFKKVTEHLKNALEELQIDEHDQLSSFYEEGYQSTEEIIKKLIKDTFTLEKRLITDDDSPEWGKDVEMCECGYHPKDDRFRCDL